MLERLFADPTLYPMPLKTWLISWLEGSDLTLPISSINGLLAKIGTGGGNGHTILDEGSALPTRASLNFVGTGVTASDDALANRTTVTIPGGGVGSDANYVHTQGSPSTTWVVVHNLNKYVAVDVVDTGGSVVIPNVHYDSLNGVTLIFGSPTSGKVFVN